MTTVSRFGEEFLVNATTPEWQNRPAIAALGDGRFVIAWTDYSQTGGDRSGAAIRAQILDREGTPVGSEFLVNTTTHRAQFGPDVTLLPDARFIVAWSDSDPTGDDPSDFAVRAQIFRADGEKEGAEFRVNTTTRNMQMEPSIAVLPDGRFVVAWDDSSQSGGDRSWMAVRAQIFDPTGGKLGSEFLVNALTFRSQFESVVAPLSNGSFVIAWTHDDPSGDQPLSSTIRAQRFAADGSPSGTEFQVGTTTGGWQANAAIAVLGHGRFVIAWSDSSQVADDPSRGAVRAQTFYNDGSPGAPEFLVNTTTDGRQAFPGLATLSDGRFVITWHDTSGTRGDPSGYGVRGQVFHPDGMKAGPEFLVNATTAGDQTEPAIAVIGEGRVAVVWVDSSETGGDTSGMAIRARILDIAARSEIAGTASDDRLAGTDAADRILGHAGHDILFGGPGDDTLEGGAGTDTLVGGAGDDLLDGGTGSNVLNGVAGRNLIRGGDLRDLALGGTGDDTIHGGDGNDELRGLEGDDLIFGEAGSDTLIGNAGTDTLAGGGLSDLIFGGDGNDFVNGGFGSDRVNGGAGADRFYHLGIADHGSDWIQDYSAAEGDRLVFGGAATRSQFQVNVAETANAGQAGVQEAFVIYRPTGQILWALVDGDAQGALTLQIGGQVFDLIA